MNVFNGKCRSAAAMVGVVLCVAGCAAGEGRPLQVTFLGNEGFLLRAGDRSVLIDGIAGNGLRGYVPLPVEPRSRLEASKPPFDRVDLVLATHAHADHFDAGAVGRFLEAAPGAQFVSTKQAAAALRQQAGKNGALGDRIRGYNPQPGQRIRLAPGGVKLQLFYLTHGETQNLGFIVEIGGKKVLHVGDTDADAEYLAQYDLPGDGIDIALLPFWLLQSESGRAAVRKQISPAQVIAMHVPDDAAPPDYFGKPGSAKQLYLDLEAAWPGIILMREPMETREFR